MKSWQAVLISTALLAAGYMVSAHAKDKSGGTWHLVPNTVVSGAWLYNDQDETQVYWCTNGNVSCQKRKDTPTP
jgi:hypothetical protein